MFIKPNHHCPHFWIQLWWVHWLEIGFDMIWLEKDFLYNLLPLFIFMSLCLSWSIPCSIILYTANMLIYSTFKFITFRVCMHSSLHASVRPCMCVWYFFLQIKYSNLLYAYCKTSLNQIEEQFSFVAGTYFSNK